MQFGERFAKTLKGIKPAGLYVKGFFEMGKRFLAVFLCLCMVTGMVPYAFAFEVGDFEYEVNEDGKSVTIYGYTGTDTTVNIPSVIDGYAVTRIGYYAFWCLIRLLVFLCLRLYLI